jgi:hypothetical protein
MSGDRVRVEPRLPAGGAIDLIHDGEHDLPSFERKEERTGIVFKCFGGRIKAYLGGLKAYLRWPRTIPVAILLVKIFNA